MTKCNFGTTTSIPGKPIIALRTANYDFWGGKPNSKQEKNVSLIPLLGGTFREAHGGWHSESTRGQLAAENQAQAILAGVTNDWGGQEVYRDRWTGKETFRCEGEQAFGMGDC